MLEVYPDPFSLGWWVARYDRWEVSRESPLRAVADVLAFEAASANGWRNWQGKPGESRENGGKP